MIVISKSIFKEVNNELEDILEKFDISIKKFKWNKFNSMDNVNALKGFLNYIFKYMNQNLIHIHTLIWDITDSRHNIVGRDDIENLSKMYYKIIRDFAKYKLKNGDILTIYPDRNNNLKWEKIEEILPNDGIYNTVKFSFCTLNKSKVFINESNTEENALIQIADIFAGMARTSYYDYDKYEKWLNKSQQSLFYDENIYDNDISVKDEHRFKIYKFIDNYSKHKSWSVSLKSNKGFRTYDKSKPLNFWFYEPQHEKDKAPLKSRN